jgi:hypothetical protein
MAPIGDRPARKSPSPFRQVSLFGVYRTDGTLLQSLGTVEEKPGTFNAWLASRLALGSSGHSLYALNLAEGVVHRYLRASDSLAAAGGFTLPRYFNTPEPIEEIWSPSWIQVGGEVRNTIEVSQVLAAAIDTDGRVYAIRPHFVEWLRISNRMFRTQGTWKIGIWRSKSTR